MSVSFSRVGVCSWSLRPKSALHLAELAKGLGVAGVQLAIDPIRLKKWKLDDTRKALEDAGLVIFSGMWMPEGEDYSTLDTIRRTGGLAPAWTWDANVKAANANAAIARDLGLGLVTFHAGVVPEREPARLVFVDRLHRIARIFAEQGVRVALETGQETWKSMASLLADLDAMDKQFGVETNVGINFDPANMLLYGMGDPMEAMRHLLPRIVQSHVKDAKVTAKRGTWGTEMPAGEGEVDWRGYFELIDQAPSPINVMIERESGNSRMEDARAAVNVIDRLWPRRADEAFVVPQHDKQPRVLGVGVLGLGFMGRTHVPAYGALADARFGTDALTPRVVAVCDPNVDALINTPVSGNLSTGSGSTLDLALAARYTKVKEFLADPRIEAVSICTPTQTHFDMAWMALEAGKHVLIEKPAVTTAKEARTLADAALGAERVVMPAMCMRFWPGWPWLKDAIDSKPYGTLKSLVFQRLGTRPAWSSVYGDDRKTGGAIGDLHIHDADIILWLLGVPSAVASVGTTSHVSTQYHYDHKPGLVVTAEGSWDHSPGWNFRIRYCATFEHATAEFDLSREQPLMLFRNGTSEAIEIPAGTGYDGEVEHFVDLIEAAMQGKKITPLVTLADAERVATLLDIERASQAAGRIAEVDIAPIKQAQRAAKTKGKKTGKSAQRRANAKTSKPAKKKAIKKKALRN